MSSESMEEKAAMAANQLTARAGTLMPQREVQSTTPATLLQMAVTQGADIDKLEKLMALQERWEAAEAKKAYTKAMSKFRADCPAIDRTKKAYSSNYAGLAETIEQVKTVLAANGLSHSWRMTQDAGTITVKCCVVHVQGHEECTALSGPADNSGKKNPIQAIASTISYLERYTLFAILGLASKEMDDDGNKGGGQFITADQAAELKSLVDSTKSDEEGFLRYAQAETYDTIMDSNYRKVKAELSKRAKK